MNIKLNNISPAEAVIQIEGEIGLNEETQRAQSGQNAAPNVASTYEKFRELLAQIVADGVSVIRVNIRSTGGSVADALLMHGALCELQGVEIHTHCYGYTASAATIIAQAASKGCRHVASTALYLVHNASTAIEGNAAAAEATATLLTKTDEQIAAIYAARSGQPTDHFRNLMAREAGQGEWLTPNEVIEAGLADTIEDVSPLKAAVSKIRNLMRQIFEPEQTVVIAVSNADPTTTLPKDDPKIENAAIALSGNQKAYLQDAELFRG